MCFKHRVVSAILPLLFFCVCVCVCVCACIHTGVHACVSVCVSISVSMCACVLFNYDTCTHKAQLQMLQTLTSLRTARQFHPHKWPAAGLTPPC